MEETLSIIALCGLSYVIASTIAEIISNNKK